MFLGIILLDKYKEVKCKSIVIKEIIFLAKTKWSRVIFKKNPCGSRLFKKVVVIINYALLKTGDQFTEEVPFSATKYVLLVYLFLPAPILFELP